MIYPLFENLGMYRTPNYEYSLYEEFHSFGKSYFLRDLVYEIDDYAKKQAKKSNLTDCILSINDDGMLTKYPNIIKTVPITCKKFLNFDIKDIVTNPAYRSVIDWIGDMSIHCNVIIEKTTSDCENIYLKSGIKNNAFVDINHSNYTVDTSTGKTGFKVNLYLNYIPCTLSEHLYSSKFSVIAETIYHELMHGYVIYKQIENGYYSSAVHNIASFLDNNSTYIVDNDAQQIKLYAKCLVYLSDLELPAYSSQIQVQTAFSKIKTKEEFFKLLNEDSYFQMITNVYNKTVDYLISADNHEVTIVNNGLITRDKLYKILVESAAEIFGRNIKSVSDIILKLKEQYSTYKMKFYDVGYYGLDDKVKEKIVESNIQNRGFIE